MANSRTVSFHTLGCKLNFSESSSIAQQFKNAGYVELPFEDIADIYIINTCSVTDLADRKCRKAVRSSLSRNPDAIVVVTGCYAQLKPEEIASIPGVRLVLGAQDKFKILEHLQNLDPSNSLTRVISGEVQDVNQFIPSYSIENRTRTFLKVQDGCDYKCSFCTIPLARGRSRSTTVEDAVRQSRELGQKGVQEIVLTGVNLGDFGNGTEVIEGIKVKKGALFIDLVKALDKVEEIERFRISSIEPNLCTQEIIEFVASSKRFMPHFHMPLQSGDNEILGKMKRRYQRELYAERVKLIKGLIPHACIGVDVIVGFPGESDAHFENTFNFLHELDVSYLHVFSYSPRSDTPASTMPSQVQNSIKFQRSQILRNLSLKKKNDFYKGFINSTQKVLLESGGDFNSVSLSGYTENYIRVHVQNVNSEYANRVVNVRLSGVHLDGNLIAQYSSMQEVL